MRIAVTGGNGRVGRAVIEVALAQGHTILNIDRAAPRYDMPRPEAPYDQVDMTDYHAVESALRACEALIHLAAIPSPNAHADHEVHNNNVVASYNALSAAAHLGIKRVCQASSINAIGGVYSRWPRYDYFPLDEQHATYAEDPYSLSKWICEAQADSFARRYEEMTIASLRIHGVTGDRATATRKWSHDDPGGMRAKHLWGYTLQDAVASACLLALTADFAGHEIFYIVAPETVMSLPSLELKAQFFPEVPLRSDLSGNKGFFDCTKAERMLGWKHSLKKEGSSKLP